LEQTERTEKLTGKTATKDNMLDFCALVGVYAALTGHRDDARGMLKGVLDKDSDHSVATNALKA
jgi:hypothetical protein